MSKVCEVCGKHPVAGRSISHSHRVTNRKFRPNIQRVYVLPTSTSDSPGQRPRVHIELTKGALPYGGRLFALIWDRLT